MDSHNNSHNNQHYTTTYVNDDAFMVSTIMISKLEHNNSRLYRDNPGLRDKSVLILHVGGQVDCKLACLPFREYYV